METARAYTTQVQQAAGRRQVVVPPSAAEGSAHGGTAAHAAPANTPPEHYSPSGKQAAAMAHAAAVAGDAQSAVGIWATRLARRPDDAYALKRRCEAALAVKRHVLAAEDAIKLANLADSGAEELELVARVAGALGWADIKRIALARATGSDTSEERYAPAAGRTGGDAVGGALERLRKRLFDAALGTGPVRVNPVQPTAPAPPIPASTGAFPYGAPPAAVDFTGGARDEDAYEDDSSEYEYEDDEDEEDEGLYEDEEDTMEENEEDGDDDEDDDDDDEDNLATATIDRVNEDAELASLERAAFEVEKSLSQEESEVVLNVVSPEASPAKTVSKGASLASPGALTSSSSQAFTATTATLSSGIPTYLHAATQSSTNSVHTSLAPPQSGISPPPKEPPSNTSPSSKEGSPTAPPPPPGIAPPAAPPPADAAPTRAQGSNPTPLHRSSSDASVLVSATKDRGSPTEVPPAKTATTATPPSAAVPMNPTQSIDESINRVRASLWPSSSTSLALPKSVSSALTYLTELEELDNTPASSEMAGAAAEDARASLACAMRELEEAHDAMRNRVVDCIAHFRTTGMAATESKGTPAMRKLRENYFTTVVAYCRALLAVGRAERCQTVLRMGVPMPVAVPEKDGTSADALLLAFFQLPEDEALLLRGESVLYSNSDGVKMAATLSADAVRATERAYKMGSFIWSHTDSWTAARRAPKVAKRTAMAAEHHAEGNECFRQKMWQSAAVAYEKALRVGVQVVRTMPPGKWASRVYANRSAASARLCHDIQMAGSGLASDRARAGKLAQSAYEDSSAAIAADGSNGKALLRHACACHLLSGFPDLSERMVSKGRSGASNHGTNLPSKDSSRLRAEAQRSLDSAVRADPSLREEASKIALHRGLPPMKQPEVEASEPNLDSARATYSRPSSAANSRPSSAASSRPSSARPESAARPNYYADTRDTRPTCQAQPRSQYAERAHAANASAQAHAAANAERANAYQQSQQSTGAKQHPRGATAGNGSNEASRKFTRSSSMPSAANSAGGISLNLATEIDHYIVLGVSKTATTDEIKSAFRKRALLCHPDKVAAASAASGENDSISLVTKLKEKKVADLFRRLREARDALSDTTKRQEHDAFLQRRGVPGFPNEIRRAPTPTASAARPTSTSAASKAQKGGTPFGYGNAPRGARTAPQGASNARPTTPGNSRTQGGAAPPPGQAHHPQQERPPSRGPAWSTANRRPVSANDPKPEGADKAGTQGGGFFTRLFRARQA